MNTKKSFVSIAVVIAIIILIVSLVLIVRNGDRSSDVDTNSISNDNSDLSTKLESEVTEPAVGVPPLGQARLQELGFTCEAMTHLEYLARQQPRYVDITLPSSMPHKRMLEELGIAEYEFLECRKESFSGLDVMAVAYAKTLDEKILEVICRKQDARQEFSTTENSMYADTSVVVGSYLYNLSTLAAMKHFQSILTDEGIEFKAYTPPEISCNED